MNSSSILLDNLRKQGIKVEKIGKSEIYRLGSKVVWLDYSSERAGAPGAFFHGTQKEIFEKYYSKNPDSFFILFVLRFSTLTESVVVSAHRFYEMFKEKNTDKKGAWKYGIQYADGRYTVKTYGRGDFDITDGLHGYDFLGLTHEQSLSIRNVLSPKGTPPPQIKGPAPVEGSIQIDGHEAAQGVLLLLGKISGYDTYTPDRSKKWRERTLGELATLEEFPEFTYQHILKPVSKIDVIWFSQGFPRFCFEVENSTNVRDGLHREFQISQATNAKFLIVGPKEQLPKFETEVESEPYRAIRDRYRFVSYTDLVELYESARQYHKAKEVFGL